MKGLAKVREITRRGERERLTEIMRRPGREFGSENPSLVYVALRWNGPSPKPDQESGMIKFVAEKLGCKQEDLRIYNLCAPSKGHGMIVSKNDLPDVVWTVRRINKKINRMVDRHRPLPRIVVGGQGGPMPLVAVWLKTLVPRIRIEIRNHHRAREVNGGPLRAPHQVTLK